MSTLDIPQSSSALMTYSLEGWRILREAKRQGYQAAKGQMQQLPADPDSGQGRHGAVLPLRCQPDRRSHRL